MASHFVDTVKSGTTIAAGEIQVRVERSGGRITVHIDYPEGAPRPRRYKPLQAATGSRRANKAVITGTMNTGRR